MDFRNYLLTSPSRAWQSIILHHSATSDSKINNWEQIRQWHTGKTGSSDPKSPNYNSYIAKPDLDIGYHFGLEMINGRLEYQIGRPMTMQGAHTVGKNETAIGICLIGNYNNVEPTKEQYFLLASLVRDLQRRFKIAIYNVLGHTNFADKTCPGKLFNLTKLKYDYIKPA
ncbi:MAG: peptidoglycan recognition protein family protein [Endomicrobiales bacterium]|nr:peptidoglycan recognition protein family protein [Endomicrobiales bacterium]